MQYFDFHAHIVLKQLFEDEPNIDARIGPGDVKLVPELCTDLPNIIESQIHQSQLAIFKEEVIVGVALYGMESHLAAEVIPLRPFLKSNSAHILSLDVLNNVISNSTKPFTDFTVSRTLDRYLNAKESFNVITRDSFSSPLPKNKVNIFFVIEGCHSLVDSINHVDAGQSYDPGEILRNLDVILKKAFILSINTTHLQQSSLCNHAFGIQLTNSVPFYPSGNGLTADGQKVIQGIFSRGICVDLKHMSYKSRRDLMQGIDAGSYTTPQPLLCTHSGFTGVPFGKWPGYIRLKKPVNDVIYIETVKSMQVRNSPTRPGAPAFNATTINLFDEEIVWIVKHGGVIGLSMDRRILGYVSRFDDRPEGVEVESGIFVDKEYLSKTEWAALGIKDNSIGKLIDEDDIVTPDDESQSTEDSIPARNEYFYDHILLHLKHFLQVCVNAGIPVAEAQKHITIGSDFDGLINPFLNIATVQDMPALKKYISMNFGFYIGSLTDSRKWAKQLDVAQFAEDLFYNNGVAFVKAFFTK